jgi:hypothetical protein
LMPWHGSATRSGLSFRAQRNIPRCPFFKRARRAALHPNHASCGKTFSGFTPKSLIACATTDFSM